MTQGSHFYAMTLNRPLKDGEANFMSSGTITPPPGTTRCDVYDELIARSIRLHPELAGASVLFFCLEPNTL